MPAPKVISLTARGDASIFPASGVNYCWQSNDLTVRLTLPSRNFTLNEGVTYLHLEIHAVQTPAGVAPLAAKTIAVGTDETSWDFDLTTEQMSFSIGTAVTADRYLFITGRDDDGTVQQTLSASVITVRAASHSGLAVAALTTANTLFLRLDSQVPDDNGKYIVFFGNKTGKIVIEDVEDI